MSTIIQLIKRGSILIIPKKRLSSGIIFIIFCKDKKTIESSKSFYYFCIAFSNKIEEMPQNGAIRSLNYLFCLET